MISVQTNHPIAIDSDDHKHPEGIYYDNSLNDDFVRSVEEHFRKKISILDLGCAGGELITHMHKKGNRAVGLEGSDHCLNVRPAMIEEIGKEPAGLQNWKNFGNVILFTCDVTKEYSVFEDGKLLQFDLITCFDVIEHFKDEGLDSYFNMVDKHLSPDGLFVSSIHQRESYRHVGSKNTTEKINYHKSIHNREWWEQKLSEHFLIVEFPFSHSNRGHEKGHNDLFACKKKL